MNITITLDSRATMNLTLPLPFPEQRSHAFLSLARCRRLQKTQSVELLVSLDSFLAARRHGHSGQPNERQPHVGPNTNTHAGVVMGVQLVVLIRPDGRRDMVEHGYQDGGSLEPGRGGASVDGKVDEDQGEGQQAPGVVFDVVELEVVGGEV